METVGSQPNLTTCKYTIIYNIYSYIYIYVCMCVCMPMNKDKQIDMPIGSERYTDDESLT